MHDLQPERSLKGIEIVVPVQQFVVGQQTKSGKQTIDSLPDGVAVLAQVPVVLGGGNSQVATASLKNLELQEFCLDAHESVLVPNTLQNLAKDEIGQPQPLPLQFAIEPTCFRVFRAPEIIDPHSGVDDDHGQATPEAAPGGTD
jgi:hypothetical protein